jgi:hypothetical protein
MNERDFHLLRIAAKRSPYAEKMPPFKQLSDKEIAKAQTHIRQKSACLAR